MDTKITDKSEIGVACRDDKHIPRKIVDGIDLIQLKLDTIKKIIGTGEEPYINLSQIVNVAKIRKQTREINWETNWIIKYLNNLENELLDNEVN